MLTEKTWKNNFITLKTEKSNEYSLSDEDKSQRIGIELFITKFKKNNVVGILIEFDNPYQSINFELLFKLFENTNNVYYWCGDNKLNKEIQKEMISYVSNLAKNKSTVKFGIPEKDYISPFLFAYYHYCLLKTVRKNIDVIAFPDSIAFSSLPNEVEIREEAVRNALKTGNIHLLKSKYICYGNSSEFENPNIIINNKEAN